MTDEVEMKWIASNASLLNLVLQSRWVQVNVPFWYDLAHFFNVFVFF